MINEFEAKFLNIDKDNVRKLLKSKNFNLKTPEYLMKRKTFDFSSIAPGKNKWGRVRQESDKITMTIKEIKGENVSDVYEIELIVEDFEKACSFFEECGARMKSFQENMRELWVRENIEITIDTWPGLNPFIEIEGESELAIKSISEELGFSFTQSVFGSIDLVYEKLTGYPSKDLILLPEITFVNPPIYFPK